MRGKFTLWCPVPFGKEARISLEHRTPDAYEPYCIVLTTAEATALGLRLIRCAARRELDALRNELAAPAPRRRRAKGARYAK